MSCNEVFRDGLVWTIRTDTNDEFESRPATAQEAQRYLPAMESALQVGPALLDQATAAQAVDAHLEHADRDHGISSELAGNDQTTAWSTPQAFQAASKRSTGWPGNSCRHH